MTLNEFITKWGIELKEIEPVDENPNMDTSDPMYHYCMTLSMGDRELFSFFSTGIGWTRYPNAADLLECLTSDASGWDQSRSFEEWAEDYGYDTDSRKAERIYKTIGAETMRLKTFLGEAYNEALDLEF